MKAALEFHDSDLASVTLEDGDAVLKLAPAYVYQWQKHEGRWRGTGWLRDVRIRVTAGSIDGTLSDFPREIADGLLSVGGENYEGIVPVPLAAQGRTRVRLELFNAEPLEVSGAGVVIEVAANGTYVEDLPDDWAPADNGTA